MNFLSNFSERLSELIIEHELTTDKLAAELGVIGSTVRRWKQAKRSISLSNALLLANYFDCSLEFLIGKTDNKLDFTPKEHLPFYERLREVMEEKNVTWYQIVKDDIVSDNNLSVWKNGTSPYLQSVIDIANYFDLTLDQFIGRDL